jgi:hypothetical protein
MNQRRRIMHSNCLELIPLLLSLLFLPLLFATLPTESPPRVNFVPPPHQTPVTPNPKPHKSQLMVRGSKLQPNIDFAPKPLSHVKPFSNWILEHQTAFSCVATLRPQNTLASSHHYPHTPLSSVYIARDVIHPHPYVIASCLSKCALPQP